MHAYIHIHSIHAHIYMHIYTCTHCMDATTPHAATLLHNSSNTYTALYIFTCNLYKTHTHTLLALIHTCYTKPLPSFGITGHQPRQVGSVLALHQHPSSMQAQTGVIAGWQALHHLNILAQPHSLAQYNHTALIYTIIHTHYALLPIQVDMQTWYSKNSP